MCNCTSGNDDDYVLPVGTTGKPSNSVASHDVDLPRAATAVGNRDGLGRASRHIGPVGRHDGRRIAMGPIPGNAICIAIADTAGCRRRQLFAIRSVITTVATIIIIVSRPDGPGPRSPIMPEKMATWPMRRGKCSARASRRSKRLAGHRYKRNGAEEQDQRVYFRPHGTHPFC